MTVTINDYDLQQLIVPDSIANGASVSTGFRRNGWIPIGIICPPVWTAAPI